MAAHLAYRQSAEIRSFMKFVSFADFESHGRHDGTTADLHQALQVLKLGQLLNVALRAAAYYILLRSSLKRNVTTVRTLGALIVTLLLDSG